MKVPHFITNHVFPWNPFLIHCLLMETIQMLQENGYSGVIIITTYILHPTPCGFHFVPDSKVHGANMGPTWVLPVSDGPHVGPMNLAIKIPWSTRQTRLHKMDQDFNLRRSGSYLLHAAIVLQGPVPALSGMEMTLLYSLGEWQCYCDFTRRASYRIHKTIEQYLFLALSPSLSCMSIKSSF